MTTLLHRFTLVALIANCLGFLSPTPAEAIFGKHRLPRIQGAKPRNIIFILADDHRFDAMSFLGHPFFQTPYGLHGQERGLLP